MKLGRVRLGFIASIIAAIAIAWLASNMLVASYLRSRNLIWHWKHHDRVQFQDYEIYVPRKWFISDFGDGLLLTDLTNGRGQIATVMIMKSAKPFNFEQRKQIDKLISERHHSTPASWTELQIGNESMFCQELNIPDTRNFVLVGRDCYLQSLEIMFSGTRPQLATFDEFLKGITRTR